MSQNFRGSAQKLRFQHVARTPTSRYADRYPLFERKPEVLRERFCNFSPSSTQAAEGPNPVCERGLSRNDVQDGSLFEEELLDAEMEPVPVASLYDCVRNGIFYVFEASKYLDDLQRNNRFSEAILNEFVASEAAARITRFDCEGLDNNITSIRSENFLTQYRINNFANRIMASIALAQSNAAKRNVLAIPRMAPPKTAKLTVANLTRVWKIEENPPFRKLDFGQLAQDWKERAQDNDYQKLTSLFRYMLKNITYPPSTIQKYSIRINGASAKDKRLMELPHYIQEKFLGFAEDLCGLGQDELRLGRAMDLDASEYYQSLGTTEEARAVKLKEKMRERLETRNDAFRALQKALKDIRACKCEIINGNDYQWIPCSKQAKKRDVQEGREALFCDGTSGNVAEFVDVEEV